MKKQAHPIKCWSYVYVVFLHRRVKMANSSKVNDCVKPPFNGCHETTTDGKAIEYREGVGR